MAKLTTKKLRLLFCDVVEQFIPLFNQKELEKGIETERLADVLLQGDFTAFEKTNAFYIVYRNFFFNPSIVTPQQFDQFMNLANNKQCGKKLYDAYSLTACDEIKQSENLTNCFHCKKCYNSLNLLYCYNRRDLNNPNEYYAFNEQVSHFRFEELKKMPHSELVRQPEYKSYCDFNMIEFEKRQA